VRIGEIAHAVGEIAGGPVIGHLHMTPGLVRIEQDEQIGCATQDKTANTYMIEIAI
jgi:hypothetical protein